jgi:cytidylate kinase
LAVEFGTLLSNHGIRKGIRKRQLAAKGMPLSAGRILITVAGQIGSGKTEVCRELNRRTSWKVISAGSIVRQMAIDHNMSVLEFNEYAKSHPEIDRKIDGYLEGLSKSADSLIIDSRLAWHFLPGAIKVYLIVDRLTGAKRVFHASRTDETHESAETAAIDNAERQRIEQERFFRLYKINAEDWRNYDLVIDTTVASPREIADVVMQFVEKELVSARPECWISPGRLSVSELHLPNQVEGVALSVEDGRFWIVDGKERLSPSQPLIQCRLVSFEREQVVSA